MESSWNGTFGQDKTDKISNCPISIPLDQSNQESEQARHQSLVAFDVP